MVDVLKIEIDETTQTEMYTVICNDGTEVRVPREFLWHSTDDDVATIPVGPTASVIL